MWQHFLGKLMARVHLLGHKLHVYQYNTCPKKSVELPGRRELQQGCRFALMKRRPSEAEGGSPKRSRSNKDSTDGPSKPTDHEVFEKITREAAESADTMRKAAASRRRVTPGNSLSASCRACWSVLHEVWALPHLHSIPQCGSPHRATRGQEMSAGCM